MMYQFRREDAVRFASEQGITAKIRGSELQFMRCPYCGNKTNDKDTFAINLETGQFKCLRASCGAKGNMKTLARDFDFSLGQDYDEYVNRRKRYRDMTRYPRPEIRSGAITYMESRGISKAITERYGITTQKEHDNVIVFPFYDENGKLQFVKYRKADFDKERDRSKEWCERDCRPILFGMDQCDVQVSDSLILTEGQIDSLSVAEAGLPNAVSVPTGANGFTWVPYCWDFLTQFKTLIVFGDHERGKITLLEEMHARFPGTVKHVRVEDYKDHKDANELLLAEGAEAVRMAVKNAVPVENPRVKALASVKRKDWSSIPHFSSGIPSLDKLTGGLYLGQLVILTGKRGHGKSTVASQIAVSAVSEGYRTFFYSGELNDWQLQGWFERQVAGGKYINAARAQSGYVRYTIDAEYEHAIMKWYEDSVYIYDNETSRNLETTEEEALIDTLKTVIKQYDCKVLIIDNLMTAMDDDAQSDLYRLQTRFVNQLSKMAKAYEVLIILIAHPRKMGRNDNDDFTNDDIAGSGNIPNLADLVLVYRKTTEKEAQDTGGAVRVLMVTKNRVNGKELEIPLYFDEASKRIAEEADGFDWLCGWEDEVDAVSDPEEGAVDYEQMDIPF